MKNHEFYNHAKHKDDLCFFANIKVLALIMNIEIRAGPLFWISVVSIKRQPAPQENYGGGDKDEIVGW